MPNDEADGQADEPLTQRERDLVDHLLHGATTNRELADRLMIGESTVHYHLAQVMRKLGCSNRTQVVIRAWQLGTAAADISLSGPSAASA